MKRASSPIWISIPRVVCQGQSTTPILDQDGRDGAEIGPGVAVQKSKKHASKISRIVPRQSRKLQSRTVPAACRIKKPSYALRNPPDSLSMSTGNMPKPGDTVSVTSQQRDIKDCGMGSTEKAHGSKAHKGRVGSRIEYFLRPDWSNPPSRPAGESTEKVPESPEGESDPKNSPHARSSFYVSAI